MMSGRLSCGLNYINCHETLNQLSGQESYATLWQIPEFILTFAEELESRAFSCYPILHYFLNWKRLSFNLYLAPESLLWRFYLEAFFWCWWIYSSARNMRSVFIASIKVFWCFDAIERPITRCVFRRFNTSSLSLAAFVVQTFNRF